MTPARLMSGVEVDINFNGNLAGGVWNLGLNGSFIGQSQAESLHMQIGRVLQMP